MTISQTPVGVKTFRVEGYPQKYRRVIDPIFAAQISGLMCLCSARLSLTVYSLYIQGVCEYSTRVKDALLAVSYRLELDIDAQTIGKEVYYYGYACDIPTEYKPVGGAFRDVGTSIFYSEHTVTQTLLVDLSGAIPSGEIRRVCDAAQLGRIPEHASFVRIRFREGVFLDASYHHIGGAYVTAD